MESTVQKPSTSTRDERQWAMLCHMSAMLMYLTVIGGFIGPLILWLLKRDEMPLVADQGRETLNFQITVLVSLAVAGLLMFIVIGIPIFIGIIVYHFAFTIIAAVKASEGVAYRYPYCWRLIS
jgi:hypothetical protein